MSPPGLFHHMQGYSGSLEVNKLINQNYLAAWFHVYEKVVASEPSVVAHTLLFSQVLKEPGLESSHHMEGLVAFVVTEVLTEASRLQTASVEVSGAQAYTNKQVVDEFSRKLVECITDNPRIRYLLYILIVINCLGSPRMVQYLFTLSLSHHRMVNYIPIVVHSKCNSYGNDLQSTIFHFKRLVGRLYS